MELLSWLCDRICCLWFVCCYDLVKGVVGMVLVIVCGKGFDSMVNVGLMGRNCLILLYLMDGVVLYWCWGFGMFLLILYCVIGVVVIVGIFVVLWWLGVLVFGLESYVFFIE